MEFHFHNHCILPSRTHLLPMYRLLLIASLIIFIAACVSDPDGNVVSPSDRDSSDLMTDTAVPTPAVYESTLDSTSLPSSLNLANHPFLTDRGEKQIRSVEDNGSYLLSTVRPIGFSADHKMAYIIEPPASPQLLQCVFTFEIKDLTSNEVLERHEYCYDQSNPHDSIPSPVTAEWVWEQWKEKLTARMIEHQIETIEASLMPPPTIDSYAFYVLPNTVDVLGPQSDTVVSSYQIVKCLPQTANEVLIERTCNTTEQDSLVYDVYIAGCFWNPVTDQLVVVVAEERHRDEGLPHEMHYEVVGTRWGY